MCPDKQISTFFQQWWSCVGVIAMVILGIMVGHDSTTVDQDFFYFLSKIVGPQPRWLLWFTNPDLVWGLLGCCLSLCLYRRYWSYIGMIIVCPTVAHYLNAWLKERFNRHNGPYLEYPSGHTTALVVALGLCIVISAGALWMWALSIAITTAGIVGLVGCGYHYITDTIGSILLASALVCGSYQVTCYINQIITGQSCRLSRSKNLLTLRQEK